MRTNTAKQRLLKGETVVGTTLGLGSLLAAEVVAHAGFDFIFVDTQHGAWDDVVTLHAFRAITMGGPVPVIRALCNNYGRIGRALDHGALGIVWPRGNSGEDARGSPQPVP